MQIKKEHHHGVALKRLPAFFCVAASLSILTPAAAEPVAPPADAPAIQFPKIDRRPTPADYSKMFPRLTAVPTPKDPQKPFDIDLRSRDLTHLDFTAASDILPLASFDSFTRWPAADKLPPAFDPARIAELGKDPGLGVRSLHARGITGKRIGLAIVDQTLLTDHVEYADRLRFYEEIGIFPLASAEMHGPAVASAAVGKTCGVAPEADLYYIATRAGDMDVLSRQFTRDFTHYAKAVRRILAINQFLPADRRIRAISLSIGWHHTEAGFADINAAVAAAKEQGILVTSSSLEETFGLRFHGLGRPFDSDPNDFASARPGAWWALMFYNIPDHPMFPNRLLVSMDRRTLAGPCGPADYAHYAQGGWSWCTPFLAGLYVLACQVDPTITPDRFRDLAFQTGRSIHFRHNDKDHTLGPIVNPPALIDALRLPAQSAKVRASR